MIRFEEDNLKTYEVSICVDDMIHPEIGTVEVRATDEIKAIEWVKKNMRLYSEKI